VEWPSELPLYYSWCHQCHQNAFLSIFPLSSGTEKSHWGLDPVNRQGVPTQLFVLYLKTLLCFYSSVSSFGTIFAHTVFMSRSTVKIFLTVSLSMFTCSAMVLTVSRRFSRTIWRTFAKFSSVLLVLNSLSQWHFLFPQKNVSATCKLLFSS